MKDLLLVSIGSFFGGGLRYGVSKMVQACTVIAFPFGSLALGLIAVLAGHHMSSFA